MGKSVESESPPDYMNHRFSGGLIKSLPVVGASAEEISRAQPPTFGPDVSDGNVLEHLLDPRIYGTLKQRRPKHAGHGGKRR